jgi:hypothetical protein
MSLMKIKKLRYVKLDAKYMSFMKQISLFIRRIIISHCGFEVKAPENLGPFYVTVRPSPEGVAIPVVRYVTLRMPDNVAYGSESGFFVVPYFLRSS